MIASLMMYARPELDQANARFWHSLRDHMEAAGIPAPAQLSNDLPPMQVWRDPGLVLSQTCGMPYRRFLHPHVALIGTPDYGLEGCPPGYYRSAVVVRADDERETLEDYRQARFAYNETGSQSGYAAAYATAAAAGFWFSDRRASEGHRNSARMVAEGAADIAALDMMSWQLMQRYDSFAKDLRVLMLTEPTPGLPLITAQQGRADDLRAAVETAIAGLSDKDRTALCLRGLIQIPKEDYLAVPTPPDETLA
ncbi:MAG: PhnD/SsuA/transferrin family substrate-binding protein [Sulfitobacter sp.]|nr:PhnD/SsuA/transferrin family substrate-binding protein [Sulfitobacter sp.]